ncbi:MAG: hypothetical protein JW793_06930, partial [Acidobacteria bacterium]|nr:hypothetical protein [Acidobacteriota bacterium]
LHNTCNRKLRPGMTEKPARKNAAYSAYRPRPAISEFSCVLHSSSDTGKIRIEKRWHVIMAAEESELCLFYLISNPHRFPRDLSWQCLRRFP